MVDSHVIEACQSSKWNRGSQPFCILKQADFSRVSSRSMSRYELHADSRTHRSGRDPVCSREGIDGEGHSSVLALKGLESGESLLLPDGGEKIASISSRAGEHSFLFRQLPQSLDMRDHTNSGGNIRRSDRGSVCVC